RSRVLVRPRALRRLPEAKSEPAGEPAPAPPPAPVGPPPPADLNAMLTALEPAIRERLPAPVRMRLSLLPEAWRCDIDSDAISVLVLDLVGDVGGDVSEGDDVIIGTRNFTFDAGNVAATPGARIGEFARVTVRDSGRGLSEAAMERIFDPSVTSRPAAAVAWPLTRKFG